MGLSIVGSIVAALRAVSQEGAIGSNRAAKPEEQIRRDFREAMRANKASG
jgi:hypothetical protein